MVSLFYMMETTSNPFPIVIPQHLFFANALHLFPATILHLFSATIQHSWQIIALLQQQGVWYTMSQPNPIFFSHATNNGDLQVHPYFVYIDGMGKARNVPLIP